MTSRFIFLLALAWTHQAIGQEYIEKGKNRYTFAQTTLGLDWEYTPATGYSYQLNSNGELQKYEIGQQLSPIFAITGLHFWGHAEFFTGFALADIPLGEDRSYTFKRSAGTGFKIFPLRIETFKIRPYIGLAVAGFNFKRDLGTQLKRVEFPILAGLTYSFKRGLLEFGCTYFYQNPYHYYINTTQQVQLNVPNISFNVDYKYFFDFSVVSLKKDKNGENEKMMDKLRRSKSLNSIMISAGPAYSFFIGHSSYNSDFRPYLDDYRISDIYPDVSIGYYHHNLDAGFNVSFRNINANLSAYGISQSVKRYSFALEGFKFFWDYHGFVPFVGLAISHESISFKETEQGITKYDQWNNFVTPGLIAGWDIRPTRSDWWGIRTNIRYYPFLKWHVQNDSHIDLQSLELNFLQLVLYPNKMHGAFFKEN